VTIGLVKLELYIPGSRSLKEKRRVLKSLIERTRDRYNVAVAEMENNDLWARATVAVVTVGNETQHVNSVLNKVVAQFDGHPEAEVISVTMEML